MAKRFKNQVHMSRSGEPITVQTDTGVRELRTEELFRVILNSVPMREMNESIQGGRLFDALQKQKDAEFIEIEDGIHDWLKSAAKVVCPVAWRISAESLVKFIDEGYEKPHQPQEKNKK